MIFIDPVGIGVHGFAGFSFEGILSSILGRSMNLRIGPEIFILIKYLAVLLFK